MKHRKTILLLLLEAAVLILVRCLAQQSSAQAGFSILSYPFELLAKCSSALAAAGTVGSGLAAALWIGLSMLPLAFALRKGKQSMGLPERLALCFLTLMLAIGLYGMTVPTKIWPRAAELGAEAEALVRSGLVAAIGSAVVLWFVLYLIRRFRSGGWDSLLRSAGVLGCLICVVLTAAAAITVSNCVLSLAETKQNGFEAAAEAALHADMPGTEEGILDVPVIILQSLVRIIPLILNVAVILRGMDLLNEMQSGAGENVVSAAERLSRICCISLGLSAALSAVFNLVQVVLTRSLSNVNVNVEFPLTDLLLTVLVLLFARLVIENKKLKDDNSLFI